MTIMPMMRGDAAIGTVDPQQTGQNAGFRWTEAGGYELVATLKTGVSPAPKGAKDAGEGDGDQRHLRVDRTVERAAADRRAPRPAIAVAPPAPDRSPPSSRA